MNFFRGKVRRSLFDLSNESRSIVCEFFRIQRRRGIRAGGLAICVIGVGGKSKTHSAGVSFAPPAVEPRKTRGAPQRKHQHARCQRVQRSEVPDAAKAYQAADCFHHIVRSLSARLIHNQDSVKRQRLYFSRHRINSSFRGAVALARAKNVLGSLHSEACRKTRWCRKQLAAPAYKLSEGFAFF